MTDPDTILDRIDDVLDGADEDWSISGDAMRWTPPETLPPNEPEIEVPPDSLAADLLRIGEATREMGRAIAEQFTTNAVNAAVELERRLDLLQALVPDDRDRAAYWTAAGGNLDRAIELAQSGEPPATPVRGPGPLVGDVGGIDCILPIGTDVVKAANPSPIVDPEAVADSIRVHISPGEAVVPGPDGLIHIRGAYGDQPAEITRIDLDHIQGDDQ